MKRAFKIIILFFFLLIGKVVSNDLINEFNFFSTTDGVYKLQDGRKFEASSLNGHFKNNLGNYGNIKCNSLIETIKDKLTFLKVICEIALNDGNKIWTILERSSESFKAGIGESKIIDATGKFIKLRGVKCVYAVTKYLNSSFVIEKCKLKQGLLEELKNNKL